MDPDFSNNSSISISEYVEMHEKEFLNIEQPHFDCCLAEAAFRYQHGEILAIDLSLTS